MTSGTSFDPATSIALGLVVAGWGLFCLFFPRRYRRLPDDNEPGYLIEIQPRQMPVWLLRIMGVAAIPFGAWLMFLGGSTLVH
jgi:uncharacterized protein YjeT (DUF2065 family)